MTCMSTLGVVVQHDGLLEITYMQVYFPQTARSYLLELIRQGFVVGSLMKTVKVGIEDRCATQLATAKGRLSPFPLEYPTGEVTP